MSQKLKTIFFILRFYVLFVVVKIVTFWHQALKHNKRRPNADKHILFLEVFPRKGAGYNYRVSKWIERFTVEGLHCDSHFLEEDSERFFQRIQPENLYSFIIKTGYSRLKIILKARQYQLVVVRRSVVHYNTYGNLFFEKLLTSIHPNVAIDFDDDIASNFTHPESPPSLFERLMLNRRDYFNQSLNYYQHFIVGSNYLKNLVLERAKKSSEQNICIIPTCVDYNLHTPVKFDLNKPTVTFGWIGGNHNLYLLEKIFPNLEEAHKKHPIELIIISGHSKLDYQTPFPIKAIKYNLDNEIDHLRNIDIGLMPLEDDLVSRGKCGFKLIQYMGLGIPGIASAITVNKEIIDDGINGWLVHENDSWTQRILEALERQNDLPEIGALAAEKVFDNYSYDANLSKYLSFLEERAHVKR